MRLITQAGLFQMLVIQLAQAQAQAQVAAVMLIKSRLAAIQFCKKVGRGKKDIRWNHKNQNRWITSSDPAFLMHSRHIIASQYIY